MLFCWLTGYIFSKVTHTHDVNALRFFFFAFKLLLILTMNMISCDVSAPECRRGFLRSGDGFPLALALSARCRLQSHASILAVHAIGDRHDAVCRRLVSTILCRCTFSTRHRRLCFSFQSFLMICTCSIRFHWPGLSDLACAHAARPGLYVLLQLLFVISQWRLVSFF